METVTVLTFNEPESAEPIRKRLESAGIQANVYDERKMQKYRFISEPLAGIRLQVAKENYPRAKDLLHEWDVAEGLCREAIHCPECGSSRVEYPQFTRKFVLPTVGILLSAVGLIPRSFYCEDCHYTWPVQQTVRKRADAFGWPVKSQSR